MKKVIWHRAVDHLALRSKNKLSSTGVDVVEKDIDVQTLSYRLHYPSIDSEPARSSESLRFSPVFDLPHMRKHLESKLHVTCRFGNSQDLGVIDIVMRNKYHTIQYGGTDRGLKLIGVRHGNSLLNQSTLLLRTLPSSTVVHDRNRSGYKRLKLACGHSQDLHPTTKDITPRISPCSNMVHRM